MADPIDSLQIEINAKASKANDEIDRLINKIDKLTSSLGKTDKIKVKGVTDIAKQFHELQAKSSKVSKNFNNLFNGLNKTSVSADKAKKSFSGLAYAFGKFYANFFLLVRGFKKLGSSIENSMNYVETYNYFKVALDKIAKESSKSYERFGYDNAEDYANSFTSRLAELNEKMTGYKLGEDGELIDTGKIGLGLDPRQIMSFQANIASITNSVGLLGETSINSAKGLSMLAQDLSSLFNVDLKTTMQNLVSGIIGQSRTLYKYGLDITNATLQQIAYANGVTKSVSAMTQAEKMQLRMIAILQQSKIAWTDSIQTINTAANQFRILKQQIANLSRTIGNLFLPIVQKILPVISGLVIALNRLLTGLGVKLFGADWLKNLNKDTSQGSSEFVDLGDSIEDTDDSMQEAQKSAEKLRRTLMGFDEINQLSPKTDDTDTGKDKGNVGGIDLSDTIGDLVSEYEDAWNKAFEKMVNDAEKWADRIEELFKRPGVAGKDLNIALTNALNSIPWDSAYEGARNFGKGLAEFLNGLISPDLFYAVGRTIANSLNTAIYSALSFADRLNWSNLGESIASGINGFFENFDAKSLAKTINKWVNGLFDALMKAVTKIKWSKIFKKIGDLLGNIEVKTLAIIVGTITIKKILKMKLASTILNQIAKAVQTDISTAIGTKLGADSGATIGSAIWNWIKKGVTSSNGKSAISSISESVSSSLSSGLKLALGGAGVMIQFASVSSAFKDITEQGTLTVDMLGKLVAGTGLAVAGLKLIGLSNPFTALIVGATGLVSAFVGINSALSKSNDEVKEYCDKTAQYRNEINNTNQQTLNDIENMKKAIEDTEASSEALDVIKQRYFELADQTELTAGEHRLLKDLATELVKKVPELSSVIDEQTGYYTGQREEIEKLIKAKQEEYKQEALRENYIESIKKEYIERKNLEKASENLEISERKLGEAMAKAAEISGRGKEYTRLHAIEYWKLMNSVRDLTKEVKENEKTYNETNAVWEEASDNMKELWSELSDTALSSMDSMQEQAGITTEELENAFGNSLDTIEFDVKESNSRIEDSFSDMANSGAESGRDLSDGFNKNISDMPSDTSNVFDEIRRTVSNSLDRIKNLFNFNWSLPDIKLPHFSISGSFSLNPPSVPTFGIDWYANGGFPEDGLFMANHNELVGKFSNGKTAVANNEQIVQGIQSGVTSAIANAIVPYLVQILNKDTTLQIDGREIGRTSVNYINGEKRRGAEPLLGY